MADGENLLFLWFIHDWDSERHPIIFILWINNKKLLNLPLALLFVSTGSLHNLQSFTHEIILILQYCRFYNSSSARLFTFPSDQLTNPSTESDWNGVAVQITTSTRIHLWFLAPLSPLLVFPERYLKIGTSLITADLDQFPGYGSEDRGVRTGWSIISWMESEAYHLRASCSVVSPDLWSSELKDVVREHFCSGVSRVRRNKHMFIMISACLVKRCQSQVTSYSYIIKKAYKFESQHWYSEMFTLTAEGLVVFWVKVHDTVVTGSSVFPFKYSAAAILEIDYLQTASQIIFKFHKEICTCWSAVKKKFIIHH